MQFDYEYYKTQEEVRKHIQECEGHHTQQVCYSTFHDALTQICFGCKKIRSSLRKDNGHVFRGSSFVPDPIEPTVKTKWNNQTQLGVKD